jgi:hypothetical protein
VEVSAKVMWLIVTFAAAMASNGVLAYRVFLIPN